MYLILSLLIGLSHASEIDRNYPIRFLKSKNVAYIDHKEWVVIDPDNGDSPLNWIASDQKHRHGRDIVIITNVYMWGFDSKSTWVFDVNDYHTRIMIEQILKETYPKVAGQKFNSLKERNNCRLFGETTK